MIPPSEARSRTLAERVTAELGWPLHVIEGAGHAPHIEQPEAFLRALSNIETATIEQQRRGP